MSAQGRRRCKRGMGGPQRVSQDFTMTDTKPEKPYNINKDGSEQPNQPNIKITKVQEKEKVVCSQEKNLMGKDAPQSQQMEVKVMKQSSKGKQAYCS